MNNKKYICPICGFDALEEEPFSLHHEPSHEICPGCGFEPGFDGGNDPVALAEFRERWINNGRKKMI